MKFAGNDGEVSASLDSKSSEPFVYSAEISFENRGSKQSMVRAWRSCMLALSMVTRLDLEFV